MLMEKQRGVYAKFTCYARRYKIRRMSNTSSIIPEATVTDGSNSNIMLLTISLTKWGGNNTTSWKRQWSGHQGSGKKRSMFIV